jgi:RES domain
VRALPDPGSLAPGPSGTASLPPSWLATRSLPLVRLRQGTPLFRVHRQDRGAVFFGPAVDPTNGTRQPPANRFDSLVGGFGVLYVASHFEGAFVETVLRNPAMRLVSELYVTLRAVSELIRGRELRLVDLHGRGLSRVGATNAISTGPYAPCRVWSDYLWSHRDPPDGVAYASRHNPRQICYVVFERPDIEFTASGSVTFADILPEIKGILRRYDKILTRP